MSPGRARRGGRFRSVARACAAAVAIGCAPPPEPPRRAEAPLAATDSELAGGFGSVEATGQGLQLDLPEADGWRRDARETRSFVAVHAASRSRLFVRAWSADAIARPDDCERELRTLRPELPVLAPAERIEARALRVAGDHAARLEAGVVPSPATAGALDGHALLFASEGRHCLALVYSTSAHGEAAPRVIGERLGAMTRVTFERVRDSSLEQRVRVPRR